jgi:hypothetical protein
MFESMAALAIAVALSAAYGPARSFTASIAGKTAVFAWRNARADHHRHGDQLYLLCVAALTLHRVL